MKTIQVTVERNFHIMNEDRFLMEKISVTIEPEEDTTDYAINEAREIIIQNFKAAYPQVHPYLNFDEVIRVNNSLEQNLKEVSDRLYFKRLNPVDPNSYVQVKPEKINKGTIEEQIQACTTLDELDSWKLIALSNKKIRTVYDTKYNDLKSKTSNIV